MKFLCLGYLNMEQFDSVPEPTKGEILKACFAQCVPFRETGKVVAEEGLEHSSKARCIRPARGRAVVSEGPFLQTQEQIGAFFIVEAEDMDEAVAVAMLHPAAMYGEEFGFGIEVRPIQ